MGEIYDYLWGFPLVGAILGIIAMLTPAAYLTEFGSSFYLWMWGLVSFQIYDYGTTAYTDNILIIIPSVIISIVIVISIIALLASANKYRNDRKVGIISNGKGLTSSIFIIVSTIAWIISIETVYISGGMSFWGLTSPGFGVIGMFLGSVITIIGYAVSKYGSKQRRDVDFIPKKDPIMKSITTPISVGSTFNFCPECGKKIISETQRFCMQCGFELQNI